MICQFLLFFENAEFQWDLSSFCQGQIWDLIRDREIFFMKPICFGRIQVFRNSRPSTNRKSLEIETSHSCRSRRNIFSAWLARQTPRTTKVNQTSLSRGKASIETYKIYFYNRFYMFLWILSPRDRPVWFTFVVLPEGSLGCLYWGGEIGSFLGSNGKEEWEQHCVIGVSTFENTQWRKAKQM